MEILDSRAFQKCVPRSGRKNASAVLEAYGSLAERACIAASVEGGRAVRSAAPRETPVLSRPRTARDQALLVNAHGHALPCECEEPTSFKDYISKLRVDKSVFSK